MNKKELLEREKIIEYYEYLISSGRVNEAEAMYLKDEIKQLRKRER